MVWAQVNLIKTLFLPPFSLLFFQALGLLFFWWRRKRVLSFFLIAVPWVLWLLLSCPATVSWMIEPIENSSVALDLDEPGLGTRADAIVVLGAGRYYSATEYGKDTVPIYGLERLRYAAHLYRKTKRPVLMSGGTPDRPGASEAELMAEVMQEDFSVPVKWKEEKSDNTQESALNSYELLKAQGIRRIFLVTHASHMMRARSAFESAGFEVTPAPMGFENMVFNYVPLRWLPNQTALGTGYRFLHESLGTFWYWIRRKISSPVQRQ